MEVILGFALIALVITLLILWRRDGVLSGERDALVAKNAQLRERVVRAESVADAERKMREDAEDSLMRLENLADTLADTTKIIVRRDKAREEANAALRARRAKKKPSQ